MLRLTSILLGLTGLTSAATDCILMGSLLTYYINGINGPCWPGYNPFMVFTEIEDDLSCFTSHRYISGDEVATYIEVGGAYVPGGKLIGDLTKRDLFLLETIHIDMSGVAANNPDYEISVEDIEEWICNYGPIPPRAFVIFNMGWSFRRGNRYYGPEGVLNVKMLDDLVGDALGAFLDYLIPGVKEFHWPGISPRAAEYLVYKCCIAGVGIDTPSVDAGYYHSPLIGDHVDTRAVRRFLTSYGVFVIHNLLLLDIILPPRGVTSTLGVFNMKCATRAPVNVYTEFCINNHPTLQCQASDYLNIVLGINPYGFGRHSLNYKYK